MSNNSASPAKVAACSWSILLAIIVAVIGITLCFDVFPLPIFEILFAGVLINWQFWITYVERDPRGLFAIFIDDNKT
jgi:hypothetical protein